VANGISTVHLSYVREETEHALIGARQWIPREHIGDPGKSLAMGLPPGLVPGTRGQMADRPCSLTHPSPPVTGPLMSPLRSRL
jgi:hypothetical protein